MAELNNNQTGTITIDQNKNVIPSYFFTPPENIQKIRKGLDDLSSIKDYQFPLDLPKYYTQFMIANYTRTDLLKIGQLNTLYQVKLPLPTQLVDSHNISYEMEPIGAFVGSLSQAGIRGLQGTIDSANKALGRANDKNQAAEKNGFVNGLSKSLEEIVGAGAGLLTDATGQAGTLAKAYLGYSPNQFMTILLKGPEYKRHELNWKFSPRNPEESRMIMRITKLIQNCAAVDSVLNGSIWSYPHIFHVGFQPNSKYLFKFKPAVVENVTINYSGGGMPAFYRASSNTDGLGAPESLEMRITFLELEFWQAGQFNMLHDPFDTSKGPIDP